MCPGARCWTCSRARADLGIEALSRGAPAATFVERDRRAMDCIRANLEKTRLASSAELICLDVFTFLGRAAHVRSTSIFADPPYTTRDQPEDFAARLLSSAGLAAGLAPDGFFVLEKSPRHPLLPADRNGWEIVRQKRYGTTEVIFLQRHAGCTASTTRGPEPAFGTFWSPCAGSTISFSRSFSCCCCPRICGGWCGAGTTAGTSANVSVFIPAGPARLAAAPRGQCGSRRSASARCWWR